MRFTTALLLAGALAAPAFSQSPDTDAERMRQQAEEERIRAQMKAQHCEMLARELEIVGVRNTKEAIERRSEHYRRIEAKRQELGCPPSK